MLNALFFSSLYSFLQSPVTYSLLCSDILFSTLFSNTLNLYSSLRVRDQISYSVEFSASDCETGVTETRVIKPVESGF
jgi:hypothetical protein